MFSKPEYNTLYNEISFEITDVDLSIVNGLKRILESDIPNVSFSESSIEIIQNNTPINNEMLQNRIALVLSALNDEQIESFVEGTTDISISMDVSHDTYGIKDITTNDFIVKYDNKVVKIQTYFLTI